MTLTTLTGAPFQRDDGHQQLRESVRRFLNAHSGEDDVRAQMATESGFDAQLWRMLGSQLELTGLTVPTTYGGSGCSLVEQTIILEEMGRRLTCAPYLSTAVLGVQALLEVDDEELRRRLLPRVASGETRLSVALTEADGERGSAGSGVTATEDPDGFRLDGTRDFVLDGHTADLLITPATRASGLGLFAVDASAQGLERAQMPTLDATRRLARVQFRKTPAQLIAATSPEQVLRRLLDVGAIAVAAEQVGGADEALASSVAFAKHRTQFGAAIGTFQAIKHRCADALVAVESARSLVAYAAWVHGNAPDEVPVAAPIAKSFCSEVFTAIAAMNIHLHGALGFTWEHNAHLFLKRAKTSEQLWGNPRHHRRVLAERLGI